LHRIRLKSDSNLAIRKCLLVERSAMSRTSQSISASLNTFFCVGHTRKTIQNLKTLITSLCLILWLPVISAGQLHAGELIILDNYQLEILNSSISNFGVEQERSEATDRGKIIERGEEVEIDTQNDGPIRNINSFKIRKIKEKREIIDPEDSTFIEYQF